MKHFTISPLVLLLSLVLLSSSDLKVQAPQVFETSAFKQGETITYRVHYGFINAGTATMHIDDKLYKVNDRVCAKMVVDGKGSSAMDMALKIRDQWITYIDTEELLPQKGYRFIREGKFKLNETTVFDHQAGKATITQDHRDDEWEVDFQGVAHDIVSGYYYLRMLDFEQYQQDEVISVNAVFENKLYDFKVRYKGKDKVKTRFGKINCVKLIPIMPENGLFKGEEAIKFWISDDKNRIPVKVEAEMFVGSVDLDLRGYRGLKHPLNFD